ncbi:MAG: AIR synthase family protein [Candidatus Odinarchaeia archaeon]
MKTRPIGKITLEELKKLILPYLGYKDPEVLIGPGVGEDAAIINLGEHNLILKIDPVSCALNRIGWLTVNVNANDIAAKGADPKWLLVSLILPTTYSGKEVEEIMRQIHQAALDIKVSVVGGHTEFNGGLSHPIVVGAMVGVGRKDKLYSVKNAKLGDKLVLTKTAGIEATYILATDLEDDLKSKLGKEIVEKSKQFIKLISVVKEAKIAREIKGVTAMHDCTEGGLITAAFEIADASNLGLFIDESLIPVAYETKKLTENYGLNPLEIVSSGSLIITVNPKQSKTLIEKLTENGIRASVIGELKSKEYGGKIKRTNGKIEEIKIPESDALWGLFDKIIGK